MVLLRFASHYFVWGWQRRSWVVNWSVFQATLTTLTPSHGSRDWTSWGMNVSIDLNIFVCSNITARHNKDTTRAVGSVNLQLLIPLSTFLFFFARSTDLSPIASLLDNDETRDATRETRVVNWNSEQQKQKQTTNKQQQHPTHAFIHSSPLSTTPWMLL